MARYSAGYNGHAKICDCKDCAKMKAEALKSRWQEGMATLPVPDLKKDQTVFVKAHFRRQPNHLRKTPKTRAYWRGILQDWTRRYT